MLVTWVGQGWTALGARLREWAVVTGKAVVAVSLLMGLIPLMFGLLLELVVLTPVRVPLHQSPVYFLWQDWALGAMYTKITVALTFMGPDWWLKAAIEQLYQDGIRNLNLTRVIKVSHSYSNLRTLILYSLLSAPLFVRGDFHKKRKIL